MTGFFVRICMMFGLDVQKTGRFSAGIIFIMIKYGNRRPANASD